MEGAGHAALALQFADVANVHQHDVGTAVQFQGVVDRKRFDLALGRLNQGLYAEGDVLCHGLPIRARPEPAPSSARLECAPRRWCEPVAWSILPPCRCSRRSISLRRLLSRRVGDYAMRWRGSSGADTGSISKWAATATVGCGRCWARRAHGRRSDRGGVAERHGIFCLDLADRGRRRADHPALDRRNPARRRRICRSACAAPPCNGRPRASGLR
jgi:hypothetical protein